MFTFTNNENNSCLQIHQKRHVVKCDSLYTCTDGRPHHYHAYNYFSGFYTGIKVHCLLL